MSGELRKRILHDLKRISVAINILIRDLDEIPEAIHVGENSGPDNGEADKR